MKFSQTRRREAEISLTPLIDILFIVLLFLVLSLNLLATIIRSRARRRRMW